MEDHLAQARRRGPAPLRPCRRRNFWGRKHYAVVEWARMSGFEGYLGIDVGSISTNMVVIDPDMRVLAREYLMTAGRPLEAVTEGLSASGRSSAGRVKILGAATTGSGRYLTADFIGADLVRNEITAQATASAAINPAVDTILEIGGQDSKFISLKNGAIVDFMMNKVCAAGTGSFLEEQAEKLGIAIKEEFGRLALASQEAGALGERCTVFMESDLVHHQQQGAAKEDLVAGLAYSIVQNYLNKVKEERRVGDTIFYQGATAANQGIVAAFEAVLGKKITVPPHHDVTGAIGAAILAMRERTWETSGFKGFDLVDREYAHLSFECQSCPNTCEIRQVKIAGEKPLFYGGRCEKYEVRREQQLVDLPDLFSQREEWLYGPRASRQREAGRHRHSPGHVLPGTHALLPGLFRVSGLTVVYSQKTNKQVIHQGVECMAAETCYPVKVAHGHILDLLAGRGQAHLPAQHHRYAPSPPRNRAGAGLPHGPDPFLHRAHGHRFCPLRRQASEPGDLFRPGAPGPAPGPAGSGKRVGGLSLCGGPGPEKSRSRPANFYEKLQARGREILDTCRLRRPPHGTGGPALQRLRPGA